MIYKIETLVGLVWHNVASLILLVICLAAISCNSSSAKNSTNKSASSLVKPAAANYPPVISAASFKAPRKPACCKGAPSRTRMVAQFKKPE